MKNTSRLDRATHFGHESRKVGGYEAKLIAATKKAQKDQRIGWVPEGFGQNPAHAFFQLVPADGLRCAHERPAGYPMIGGPVFLLESQCITRSHPRSIRPGANAINPPSNIEDLPKFTVACDVSNPLLGPRGCTRIYGPQKGIKDLLDKVKLRGNRLNVTITLL